MHVIIAETGFGPVSFFGDALNSGDDFFISANSPLESVKIVFFFDSRGISAGDWESSLLKMLTQHFSAIPYLAIGRPLELTIWATVYNFFQLNKIRPEVLITNMGLVDCTPKKQALCQSMKEQIDIAGGAEVQELEKWTLSNGAYESLCTINYSETYLSKLKGLLDSMKVVLIKSPIVEPSIKIERIRPPSFFSQLNKTNQLIDELGCPTVELGVFGRELTYDAVHWTEQGNRFVFARFIEMYEKINK